MGSFLQVMAHDYRGFYKKHNLGERSEFLGIWEQIRHDGAWKRFTSRRSACPACSHVLGPLELVPIISFTIQRGRCTACGSRIPWGDLVIEFALGGIFVLSYMVFGITPWLWFWLFVWVFATLIFVFDLYEMEIPNLFLGPFLTLSVTQLFFISDWKSHLMWGAILGLFFSCFVGRDTRPRDRFC